MKFSEISSNFLLMIMKETAIPREYAFKVCKEIRWLVTIDDLKNPFGTDAPKKGLVN
jgi:hypothetical protein